MKYSTKSLTVILFVCVSVIPLMLFGIITLYEDERILKEKQLVYLNDVVSHELLSVDLFFQERFFDITVLSKIPVIDDNISLIFSDDFENTPQYQTIHDTLKLYQETYGYESIWILDENHLSKIIVGHDQDLLTYPKAISHTEHEEMLKGPYLSNVYSYTHLGQTEIELFVSVPLFLNSNVVGFIMLDAPVDSFVENFASDLDYTNTGETILFQKTGESISHLTPLRFLDIEPLSEPVQASDSFAIPAFQSTSGISGQGESIDYRGEKILAAWDYSKLTKWGLVAKIDTSEALSPLNSERYLVLLMISVLITASFGVATVLYKITTSPLTSLSNAAKKVRKQDFDVSLTPSGPTEYHEIMVTFNDMVKSLKKSQKISEEEIEELEQIDQQKGEFAAMASHELKTPLVPIKGYLEMLLEPDLVGNLSEKQCEILHKVYENTELIERLVLKILTAQRLGLGQMKWKFSEFDIFDLMQDVYTDNKSLMEDKEIEFVLEPVSNFMINSDYDQIKQVFSNLVQNAVDFVPSRGKITISALPKDEYVEFYVSDNGPGISDEHQKHLFKKFYQVDTSVRRKHGGTGLGLSICKGISDGLGGKIWVNSKLDSGSAFHFTIPKEKKN